MKPKDLKAAIQAIREYLVSGHDPERMLEAYIEVEAARPGLMGSLTERLLDGAPFGCDEAAECLADFAALRPEEAAERMPRMYEHVASCPICQVGVDLARSTEINLPPLPPVPRETWPPVQPDRSQAVLYASGSQVPTPGTRPAADLLVLNESGSGWRWRGSGKDLDPRRSGDLEVGNWVLHPAPAAFAAELAGCAPPLSLSFLLERTGTEVTATIAPPSPTGEDARWQIRFQAEPFEGGTLSVSITGPPEALKGWRQFVEGQAVEFNDLEPLPAGAFYEATFEWSTGEASGRQKVLLPAGK